MNGKKKLIMVIDDDKDLCEILAYKLSGEGYQIMTAGNGKEAIGLLANSEPALIILDLNLPEMGGVEFFDHISDNKSKALYPVLILTARQNMRELFKSLDVKGFIAKPFDMQMLIEKIKTILNETEEQAIEKGISNDIQSVLIAEYDQDIFDKIAMLFLNNGKSIISAKTGVEAIERANNKVPDLCLVSLNLPDLSGDLVAYRLRKVGITGDKRIIVYNAGSSRPQVNSIREECIKQGVQYLDLNFFEQLLELVTERA